MFISLDLDAPLEKLSDEVTQALELYFNYPDAGKESRRAVSN